MMSEYYAIYDINKQEYFVASGPLVVERGIPQSQWL